MSYECCGSGATAGDSFAASLSGALRLLRGVRDYAADRGRRVAVVPGTASGGVGALVPGCILVLVVVLLLLAYAYLRVVSGRVVRCLTGTRDWLVGLPRGWRPIGKRPTGTTFKRGAGGAACCDRRDGDDERADDEDVAAFLAPGDRDDDDDEDAGGAAAAAAAVRRRGRRCVRESGV